MKKKIPPIGIILLFVSLAYLPNINSSDTESSEVFDRVIVYAIFLKPIEYNGFVFIIYCRLYNQSSGEVEIYRFKWMTYNEIINGMGGIGSFIRRFEYLLGIIVVLVGGVVR